MYYILQEKRILRVISVATFPLGSYFHKVLYSTELDCFASKLNQKSNWYGQIIIKDIHSTGAFFLQMISIPLLFIIDYYNVLWFPDVNSCCKGEGRFPGPKGSTHHCSSQVGGSAAECEIDGTGFIICLDIAMNNLLHLYTSLKNVDCRSSQEAATPQLWNFTTHDGDISQNGITILLSHDRF